MKILLATDLHLTDRPEDEYRWGLFPWLEALCAKENIQHAFFLGDLTDSKDRHSASLVNSVTRSINSLRKAIGDTTEDNSARVHLLMGNHDFIDKRTPFFDYLRLVQGISFYQETAIVNISKGADECLIGMVPFQREDSDFYDEVRQAIHLAAETEMGALSLLLIHQTLSGSRLSNGTTMTEGLDTEQVDGIHGMEYTHIYSGDIHIPQTVGPVKYVGSPYQIKFGDEFEGRVLVYDTTKSRHKAHKFPCLRKWTFEVTGIDELESQMEQVGERDMVKVRLNIPRRDIPDSGALRRQVFEIAQGKGAVVSSVTLRVSAAKTGLRKRGGDADRDKPVTSLGKGELFDQFCSSKSIDKGLREFGKDIVEGGIK